MKKLLSLLFLLGFGTTVSFIQAQSTGNVPTSGSNVQPQSTGTSNDSIYQKVEVMPEFPGGNSALFLFLATNVKYPTISQENGIQGRVIVSFVIDKDGSITDIEVVRSIDPILDKEAIRVIKIMPKWKPGMIKGKPVRVKYTVPVTFSLTDSGKKE